MYTRNSCAAISARVSRSESSPNRAHQIGAQVRVALLGLVNTLLDMSDTLLDVSGALLDVSGALLDVSGALLDRLHRARGFAEAHRERGLRRALMAQQMRQRNEGHQPLHDRAEHGYAGRALRADSADAAPRSARHCAGLLRSSAGRR